jgi:hypothetical protein
MKSSHSINVMGPAIIRILSVKLFFCQTSCVNRLHSVLAAAAGAAAAAVCMMMATKPKPVVM